MAVSVQIVLSDKLFTKDPEQSKLGKKIVTHSIELIEELGFEKFTFRKLANSIGTVEASIYRYFENKHKLLFYLTSWYWAWLEYRIDYGTHNIPEPKSRLKTVLKIIAESYESDPQINHINENLLHKIVVAEASKVYLTKEVDIEHREGMFKNYSSLCTKIAEVILSNNVNYPFPVTLASNLIETAQEQIFFSEHLPGLTDLKQKNTKESVLRFLEHLAFSAIYCPDDFSDTK